MEVRDQLSGIDFLHTLYGSWDHNLVIDLGGKHHYPRGHLFISCLKFFSGNISETYRIVRNQVYHVRFGRHGCVSEFSALMTEFPRCRSLCILITCVFRKKWGKPGAGRMWGPGHRGGKPLELARCSRTDASPLKECPALPVSPSLPRPVLPDPLCNLE